jgi:hypothetical protein
MEVGKNALSISIRLIKSKLDKKLNKEILFTRVQTYWFGFLFVALFFLLLLACRKDPITKDASDQLSFSKDTVLFDTVFTTVGSSTRWMKVFNNSKKKIVISNIRLGDGNSSFFRINVNGKPGLKFKDVEIAGKDSIFIFVEVTVDPNRANNPLVVSDSIMF